MISCNILCVFPSGAIKTWIRIKIKMMQVLVIILRNAFSRGRGAASLQLVCLARRHVHTFRSMGKRASRDLRTAHTSLKDQLIGWCAARVRTQNDKKAAAFL